jgi:hypothetical protein
VRDLMGSFFASMLRGPMSERMLRVEEAPGEGEGMQASNYSRCAREGAPEGDLLLSAESHSAMAANASAAGDHLKQYIQSEGPALAILHMSEAGFDEFVQHRNATPLRIRPPTRLSDTVLHAVAVTGWQGDAWQVQNSIGDGWGVGGTGWVLAPLEQQWYSLGLQTVLQPDQPFTRPVVTVTSTWAQMQQDGVVLLLTILSMGSLAALLCLLGGPPDRPFF